MKRLVILLLFLLETQSAHADFWGGDLPLLAQIVTNTLNTLMEMRRQTELLNEEMRGIKDKIDRVQTIAEVIQPSTWEEWKDPEEALRRLRLVYHTLPKEYRSEKADLIEDELSRAMNLVSRLRPEAERSFASGKELEQRGADASPGVAQKLTASGIGTLVAQESQTQVILSHITSLLVQSVADANDRESRRVVAAAQNYSGLSNNLRNGDSRFSTKIFLFGVGQ